MRLSRFFIDRPIFAIVISIVVTIIGGLVLRIGDVIVDGSVKARIRQLRRRLATAEVRGDVQ